MSRKNTKIITIIILGIIIALLISYLFPTLVKNIIDILKNDPVKLFSTVPSNTVTIIFKLNYQKHRKKRKKR